LFKSYKQKLTFLSKGTHENIGRTVPPKLLFYNVKASFFEVLKDTNNL